MTGKKKKIRECACVNVRASVYVWNADGQDGEVGGVGGRAVIFLEIICSHVTRVKGISLKSSRHNEWCDAQ